MILSIEFTSEYIYLAETSTSGETIKIGTHVKVPMPDGAYVNGIVSNTAAVAAAISSAVKENHIRSKKVTVLVSGMDLMQREFSVPAGKSKQTNVMVEHELERMGLMRPEYIFDYCASIDFEQENMQNIHAYLLQKALVQNYETTIRRAGLIPYRMELTNIAMECLMLALSLDEKSEMSILCCAEKDQIVFLFGGNESKLVYRFVQIRKEDAIEESAFIVSAVQTIMSPNDPTEKVLESVIENVSKLAQFHMQKSGDVKIGQILMFGGMAGNDKLLDQIETATGIETRRCELPDCVNGAGLEDSHEFLNIVGASAGMLKDIGDDKNVNFFEVLRCKSKKQGVTRKDLIPLTTGLLIICCATLFYPIISGQNTKLEEAIAADQQYMDQADKQKAYNDQLKIKEYTSGLRTYNETCDEYIEIIQGARRLEAADIRKISGIAGDSIVIKTFSFSDSTLRIACEATSRDGAASFAKKLTDANIFTDVVYQGFTEGKNAEGNTAYVFNIECILWGEEEVQQ